MGKKSMLDALLLIAVLALCSLVIIHTSPSSASPLAPVFTLRQVDYSYDVAPTTTSSTDPYTGKTTTTTISGYHVENKTIEASIENNINASYYNFRYKGHYEDQWSYYPFDPDSVSEYNVYDGFRVPCQASNASYTVISLDFLPKIIEGEIDIQVQALIGSYRAVPYGHFVDLDAPTYDFFFEGTTSEWSNTQTITIGESTITHSPAVTLTPSQISSSPAPTITNLQTSTEDLIEPIRQDSALLGLDWGQTAIILLSITTITLAVALLFTAKRRQIK